MMDAKNTMLHFMAQSGVWPIAHAESLAAFYVALDLHPRKLQVNGKQALMLYQSRVRREWFDALKRDEGFNIELIQDILLHSFTKEINNRIVFKEKSSRYSALHFIAPKLNCTLTFPLSPLLHFLPPLVFSCTPTNSLFSTNTHAFCQPSAMLFTT
jgi:hypothetical protein